MENCPRKIPDYVSERLSAVQDIGRSWINAAILLAILMAGTALVI